MEEAHIKIPRHFLLDGFMRQSDQILRLGRFHSGYESIYMHFHLDLNIYIYYTYFIILYCIILCNFIL